MGPQSLGYFNHTFNMVLGWKNENPDVLENDDESIRAINSELVVDRREIEPSQNSESNQVVLKSLLTSVG